MFRRAQKVAKHILELCELAN